MTESLNIGTIKTDGGTQPRAHLYEEVVAEYADLLSSGAELPAVTVHHDGSTFWLSDGFHRFHAHRQAGLETILAEVITGTRRDAILYSVGANSAHGLRRTNEDKRRAVETLLEDDEWGAWSDREIARKCGVDHKTVSKLRECLTGENPQSESPQRTYTTRHGTTATMNTERIGRQREQPQPDVPSQQDEPAEPHNHRAQGTGENEWYTPPDYIEAARRVMGSIDLDPATSMQANESIRAESVFTVDDNGLAQEWHGNVWLNPPYSQPSIHHFAEKMSLEWGAGRVEQAIVLTHNYTDTRWFHVLAKECSAICFTRGRIAFVSTSGEKAAPTQGQAFFYFGDNIDRFAEQFIDTGFIVEVQK